VRVFDMCSRASVVTPAVYQLKHCLDEAFGETARQPVNILSDRFESLS